MYTRQDKTQPHFILALEREIVYIHIIYAILYNGIIL